MPLSALAGSGDALAVGVDLVKIARIRRLLQQHPTSLQRIWSDEEIAHASTLRASRRDEFLAGRFAVKEAFCKAVGKVGLDPREISCGVALDGAPEMCLVGGAKVALGHAFAAKVSVSHDGGLAIAVVALVSQREQLRGTAR